MMPSVCGAGRLRRYVRPQARQQTNTNSLSQVANSWSRDRPTSSASRLPQVLHATSTVSICIRR